MPTNTYEDRRDLGEFEVRRANELTVITSIQRIPKQARIRKLSREWSDDKAGILLVAKITDGEHAGKLHVYDGGTRWAAKFDPRDELAGDSADREFEFPVWEREMTEAEAAEAFLTFNTESRKPSAYSQYAVAVEASHEWATVLHETLEGMNLEINEGSASYGNGVPGVITAAKSMQRIIEDAHSLAERNMIPDEWDYASKHVTEVLNICRAAYSNGTAHDSDLLQAVSRLLTENREIIDAASKRKLSEKISYVEMVEWRARAQAEGRSAATYGGSTSRAVNVARQIAKAYNSGMSRTPESGRLSVAGQVIGI